ncbi:MAG: hypothetical protein ACKVON_06370 [Beijerinckiaceae bacterium]
MAFRASRLPQFVEDYERFFGYLKSLSEPTARRHYARFESAVTDRLLDDPLRYGYFQEAGAPWRGKLFRVGRKAFWIIFTVEADVVTLCRFWDCAREPGTHGL